MTLTFDPTAKKIVSLSVEHLYGASERCGDVEGPDGQSVLNASAKQLVVTTTNSNYQRLGGS
jgi:hypothetical protein